MYFRYAEDPNEKINHGSDDHDDYEEFFKKMPYYRKQIPFLPQMYYPMMYYYPTMWSIQKLEEEVKDLKRKNYAYNYRCKECEEDGNCKTKIDTPLNQNHTPVCEDEVDGKPVMNIPMNQNQIPVCGNEEEDVEDLNSISWELCSNETETAIKLPFLTK